MGTLLLDRHSNRLEVYFIADDEWKQKLERRDSRFKFGLLETDKEANIKRMNYLIDGFERALSDRMSAFDKMVHTWKIASGDPFVAKIDLESEKLIRKIAPDFILADQSFHMPALLNLKIPYAFVMSCNPLRYDFDEFPIMGSNCKTADRKAIRECRKRFEELHRPEVLQNYERIVSERGAEYRGATRVNQLISEQHFSIYSFPEQIDYYDEERKRKYNLWQIDSPLFEACIPMPYELPEAFERIPLPLIYVSLGTMFSGFTNLLQRLLDMLERLPYKYIVSKGRKGDEIKLPSDRFIGSNHVNQLAALQVCDAAICHGKKNSKITFSMFSFGFLSHINFNFSHRRQ